MLVGTGTLRAERYGRIAEGPGRASAGGGGACAAEPLACIVTRSGDVPLDIPLFAEPEARIVVFTAAPDRPARAAAQVEVVLLEPGELTFATVLRRLRADTRPRAAVRGRPERVRRARCASGWSTSCS